MREEGGSINMSMITTKFGNEEEEMKSWWMEDAITESKQHLSDAVWRLFQQNSADKNIQSTPDNPSDDANVVMEFTSIGFQDTETKNSEDIGIEDVWEDHQSQAYAVSSSVKKKDGVLTVI